MLGDNILNFFAFLVVVFPLSTRRVSSSVIISSVRSLIFCKDLMSSSMRSSLLLRLSFFIYHSRDIFSMYDVIIRLFKIMLRNTVLYISPSVLNLLMLLEYGSQYFGSLTKVKTQYLVIC